MILVLLMITIIIMIKILVIINLIYIARFDIKGILTAQYIVIKYIQMHYMYLLIVIHEHIYSYAYSGLYIYAYAKNCYKYIFRHISKLVHYHISHICVHTHICPCIIYKHTNTCAHKNIPISTDTGIYIYT